ncbi:unnamed protein product [Moneuplotes crassus]|uniref:Uncharacterized protein n=2 Tax=Euplotes crassus TaxID=5936 RepID=A0AAD2D9Y9_EUPCR|nr:unnamed protein product [Moneuplotes crassus]
MKILFAIAIAVLMLVGFTTADTLKQEVAQVIEENTVTQVELPKSISILDAVRDIKATKTRRFLADTVSADADPMRTLYQAYIWIPIILAVTLFVAVMATMNMDLNKENDTLIYAKFITSSS